MKASGQMRLHFGLIEHTLGDMFVAYGSQLAEPESRKWDELEAPLCLCLFDALVHGLAVGCLRLKTSKSWRSSPLEARSTSGPPTTAHSETDVWFDVERAGT